MADVIIIVIITTAVFGVLRIQLRKLRRGQCSGGCTGCSGSCCGCVNVPVESAKK